jgi:hypothetical protein
MLNAAGRQLSTPRLRGPALHAQHQVGGARPTSTAPCHLPVKLAPVELTQPTPPQHRCVAAHAKKAPKPQGKKQRKLKLPLEQRIAIGESGAISYFCCVGSSLAGWWALQELHTGGAGRSWPAFAATGRISCRQPERSCGLLLAAGQGGRHRGMAVGGHCCGCGDGGEPQHATGSTSLHGKCPPLAPVAAADNDFYEGEEEVSLSSRPPSAPSPLVASTSRATAGEAQPPAAPGPLCSAQQLAGAWLNRLC